MMAPLLHRQPFKVIYLTGFLVAMIFIQLPCWLIYYSWRPNRPRKTWTLHRTICARMLRKLSQLPTTAGVLTNRDLSLEVPQKKLGWYNSRFVWVPELEREDIVGIVGEHASRAGVKSIAIPAYWILKDGVKWSPEYEKAREDEKAVLYFHGGAFMTGTAHPSHPTSSTVPKGILKHSTTLSRVLSVDYRLSSGPPLEPRNPFPAAVLDAIAAYKYLVFEIGFLAENITVAGDSAGGSLALALTRYTVESRLPHLPPPGGLFAASPWANMSFHSEPSSSHLHNLESDIFAPPRDVVALIIGAYIGEIDLEETEYNRYLSPASKFAEPADIDGDARLFSGFPRSYIMGGGAEVLFDDIVRLTERMKDDGVDTTTDFPPDAVHAYPLFSWHEPERTESFIKCAAWLDECWVPTVVIEPCEVEDTLL